jgi:hypothetical protein
MNLRAMIVRCRLRTQDVDRKPHLWADEEFIDGLNEAGDEACIRARLIEKDDIELDQSANEAYADLPDELFSVQRVTFNGRKLMLCDKQMLDEVEGEEWEARTADVPVACYEVGGRLRFYPIPTTTGVVIAQGFCTPAEPMVDDDDSPDWLPPRLHEKLVDWALHVAYLKQDADTFDPKAAEKYAAEFERTFGPRPDEKAMRRLRINVRRAVSGAYF